MAATNGYVDPKWGAAPTGGAFSLDPQKGWVPIEGTKPANAGAPAQGIISSAQNAGYQFVDQGGTQVLAPTATEMGNLQQGVDAYNKATGKSLTAMQYDQMINPSTYTARWNADGTAKSDDSSAYVTPQASGWLPADAAGGGTGAAPTATGTGASGTGAKGGSRGIVSGASGYAPWTITPDQTVEGRIQSIVNGAIGTQAKTNATEEMAARGLQNSDLAISAGEQAALAAAQPIAAADAATAAKAAGYNADIQNQMSMQNKQLGSQERIAQLQADTQRYTADLNAKSQQLIAGMDNANRVQIQQMQNDNQRLLQTNSSAATAFNQSMVAIANIEQNDKMDATAKTQAIAQIMQSLQMQLNTIGSVASIDLSGTLNFSNMPGFDAQGNWVGFGGAAGESSPEGSASVPGWTAPIKNIITGGTTTLSAQYADYKNGGGSLSPQQWYQQVWQSRAAQ